MGVCVSLSAGIFPGLAQCIHHWLEWKIPTKPFHEAIPQSITDRTWSLHKLSLTAYVCAQSCLTFYNPWTVAHQAPLTTGFSRQEYWSGLPFPTPGDLPQLRNRTQVSCIGRRILDHWATWEALGCLCKKRSQDGIGSLKTLTSLKFVDYPPSIR